MTTPETRAETYQPHLGREPVFNVWDNKSGIFTTLKDRIKHGDLNIQEALRTANDFFGSTDPAKVKAGIHISFMHVARAKSCRRVDAKSS